MPSADLAIDANYRIWVVKTLDVPLYAVAHRRMRSTMLSEWMMNGFSIMFPTWHIRVSVSGFPKPAKEKVQIVQEQQISVVFPAETMSDLWLTNICL